MNFASESTLNHVRSIAVRDCVDPVLFERERERVFRATWLKVARSEDIPNPGDYVTRQIEVLDTSLIVLRDDQGKVRVFYNACTHRGNRLVEAAAGKARSFVCNFHGWSFDLTGRLRHITDEPSLGGLDKATAGLRTVHHEEWLGFIFVNLGEQPAEPLRDYLGPVAALTDDYPLASMKRVGRYRATIRCNWKTFQDAFSEGYHVQTVHRRSLPDLRKEFMPRILTAVGRHGNMSATMKVAREPFPTEKAIVPRSTGFMRSGGGQLPKGMNRFDQKDWAFDQFVLFPNLNIILGNGWATSHEFWPINVDETRWEASYYVSNAGSPVSRIANEFFKVRVRDTVREDLLTMESVHAGQKSGAISKLLLSTHEQLLAHHRAVLAQYLGDATDQGDR